MAEAAELTSATVSVPALFTSCIEQFDIAVDDVNLSEEHEQLFTLFSLQRIRFGLWGESIGLIPSYHEGQKLRYDKKLDRPDINAVVLRILKNIKSMLDGAKPMGRADGLGPVGFSHSTSSRGLEVFKQPYERLKFMLQKAHPEVSSKYVFRLDIHRVDDFEAMISRLRDFVDGLESITKSFGLLEQQHAKLVEEIKDISDVQSLRLLRDATLRKSSLQFQVFETATQRLELMTGSVLERLSGETLDFSTIYLATTASITTSGGMRSLQTESLVSNGHSLSESARLSLISGQPQAQKFRAVPPLRRPKEKAKPATSCTECLTEHYKCVTNDKDQACTRCLQMERACSFLLLVQHEDEEANEPQLGSQNLLKSTPEALTEIAIENSTSSSGLPQNQRLLSDLVA
ncbi:hypothetical protein ONS95_006733 [Cadophora gregata]|uniref:uncharacterized protein n=1 Tax=Cadophora gregata TaxID=51156 RepID=UPI0026DCCFED|nr:uncharacterized protein ONS95_006733 [Cadophora gregata]KAK0101569.1 hypothetical protein ONS95_006733 [Cadophora gregata]KAK0106418.1 hypothetical protein ONS96_004049 [Cadophora gregata f. sp. sojae]